MPQLQTVDLNPLPRTETTPLEKTLAGFSKRYRENQIDEQDRDAISDIYKKYKEEGENIDDAIMSLHMRKMSPTARVNAANNLLSLKKTNTQLQSAEAKAAAMKSSREEKALEKTTNQQAKIDKEQEKKRTEEELDDKEIQFIQSLEGKSLKPTEIYKQARLADIPRVRAKDLATLYRMEGKEGRLSEGDISKQYEFELKDIDRQLKNIDSPSKREPLEAERKRLQELRKSDLARYRAGEREFTLGMHAQEQAREQAEQAVEQEQTQEEVLKDAFIELLTKDFPPGQYKGVTKWVPPEKSPDGKKHQYKSDGKKWVQVS